jgi:hypothetical protein
VLARLVGGRGTVPRSELKEEVFSGAANQRGKIVLDAKKRSVRIDLANIDPARFAEVKAVIKKLLG